MLLPRVPLRLWRPLCAIGDLAGACVAMWAAFWVRINVPVPFTRDLLAASKLADATAELVPLLLAQVLALYFFGFYDPPAPRPDSELSRRLTPTVTLAMAAFATYLFLGGRTFPRSAVLLWGVFDFLLLWAWRACLRRRLHLPRRRVVVVGSGEPAREIAELVANHPWSGLAVAGHLPIPGEEAGDAVTALGPCLGAVSDLPRLLADGTVDDIILTSSADSWQTRLIDALAGLRPDRTNVLLLPGPFDALIGSMRYRSLQDVPLIEVVRESEWRRRVPIKRLLDLVGALTLLVLAVPPVAISALLVRITSPGPVLYRQERVGRGRRPFVLFKLRTMVDDAERASGEVLAVAGDPRITAVGAWLRRTRLDEVPQLINVLRGEMSLVGPRPERPGFVQRYLAEVPGYAERFSVAPGVTGLAQIAGDYHSSAANKLRYDLAYVANWSLWLDLSILVRTVKIVLSSRGV
jgi:exopolysaccharide biosynthesis polyprenyl glycosylphosphotransferase